MLLQIHLDFTDCTAVVTTRNEWEKWTNPAPGRNATLLKILATSHLQQPPKGGGPK